MRKRLLDIDASGRCPHGRPSAAELFVHSIGGEAPAGLRVRLRRWPRHHLRPSECRCKIHEACFGFRARRCQVRQFRLLNGLSSAAELRREFGEPLVLANDPLQNVGGEVFEVTQNDRLCALFPLHFRYFHAFAKFDRPVHEHRQRSPALPGAKTSASSIIGRCSLKPSRRAVRSTVRESNAGSINSIAMRFNPS